MLQVAWKRVVVKVGDQVEIVGIKDTTTTTVTGVEMFHKLMDEAEPGDAVGVLLRGIDRDEVERGQVLAAPGSIQPHLDYEAQVYVLSKEEGGRHTPFFNGYKPQFFIRTTDVTGEIQLPDGTEMVMPGDNIEMNVKLITSGCRRRAAPICCARRWSDRWLRRHNQDQRLAYY